LSFRCVCSSTPISPFELGASRCSTFINASDIPATLPATSSYLAQFQGLAEQIYAAQCFTEARSRIESPFGAAPITVEQWNCCTASPWIAASRKLHYARAVDHATMTLTHCAVNPRRPGVLLTWPTSGPRRRSMFTTRLCYVALRLAEVQVRQPDFGVAPRTAGKERFVPLPSGQPSPFSRDGPRTATLMPRATAAFSTHRNRKNSNA